MLSECHHQILQNAISPTILNTFYGTQMLSVSILVGEIMQTQLLLLCLIFAISLPLSANVKQHAPTLVLPEVLQPQQTPPPMQTPPFLRTAPTIQIAILLDASGSMGGLIDQAREQIWSIINAISDANKQNTPVTLQVALFEYGVNHQPKYNGYLQLLSPLTTDLDHFSERLFAITIGGSKEFAPQAIQAATQRLQWSRHPDDLRLIIIAGNEHFQQGDIPMAHAIPLAVNKNIIINTLYCGSHQKGKTLQWAQAATLGHGKYLHIDHKKRAPRIETPFDDDIILLGQQLNDTYIGYGHRGVSKKAQQVAQDNNASSLSKSSSTERSITKARKQYQNPSWDLVSLAEKNIALSVKHAQEDQQHFKGLNEQQIKAKLKQTLLQRQQLQQRITQLEKKRQIYLQDKQKKKKTRKSDLGHAMISTIQEQAQSKGFQFP